MSEAASNIPNDLESYWMPFTANRAFKAAPRLFESAKGVYYRTTDGRDVLDSASGMWCSNLGHCHPRVVEAIRKSAAQLDYVPAFQMGHPAAFQLATRVADMLPGDLDHVFFTNSGSESVDTALKIALAFHHIRGEGTRTRLIGRERGYHGVGFGGISVGGMVNNRKSFGPLLPGVDHLPHTLDLEHNAFSRGLPDWGVHFADELENIVALHGAATIAAVIVEPVAGSAGVLPPPKGYLERLREITSKHGILLIFDEVITAFGRLGRGSAAEFFGVQPDIVAMAKGLTAGTVPMGGVAVRRNIHETFMEKTPPGIELFHGYTYSGHPLACAAGLAVMDVYEQEGLFERVAGLTRYFEDAMHSLKDAPYVIDIRNMGWMCAVELEPRPDAPTERAYEAFLKALEAGVFYRINGETFAVAPPLVSDTGHIDQMVETLRNVLGQVN